MHLLSHKGWAAEGPSSNPWQAKNTQCIKGTKGKDRVVPLELSGRLTQQSLAVANPWGLYNSLRRMPLSQTPNISRIGSFPQVGMKIKKYLKPPPSLVEDPYKPSLFGLDPTHWFWICCKLSLQHHQHIPQMLVNHKMDEQKTPGTKKTYKSNTSSLFIDPPALSALRTTSTCRCCGGSGIFITFVS